MSIWGRNMLSALPRKCMQQNQAWGLGKEQGLAASDNVLSQVSEGRGGQMSNHRSLWKELCALFKVHWGEDWRAFKILIWHDFFFFWKKISLVAGVDWFCVGQEWKQDEHALVPGIQMLWWFRLCSAIPRAWPEMTNRMVGYVQILASRNGGGAGAGDRPALSL